MDPSSWTGAQVAAWVRQKYPQDEQIIQAFENAQLNGFGLLHLTNEELRDDMGIKRLGTRKMVQQDISQLKGNSSSTSPQQDVAAKFLRLLGEAGINTPQQHIVNKASLHFSTQIAAAAYPQTAVDIYTWAKEMPGTTTRAKIQSQTNVTLNEPFNVDIYGPKIISGVDAQGKPILVKIIGNKDAPLRTNEKTVIPALGLASILADFPIVACKPAEVVIEDVDSSVVGWSGILDCIIMPQYPTSLALLPQLPHTAILHGLVSLKQAIAFIHQRGYIHSDIKPANVLVSTEGQWKLADFDSCVPLSALVIGHTQIFICENFVGKTACTGIDFYMLAVTILVEADKSIRNNAFMRIKGPNGYAVHGQVVLETNNLTNTEIRVEVLALLEAAKQGGINI